MASNTPVSLPSTGRRDRRAFKRTGMGSACRKAGFVEAELLEVARFAHGQIAGQVAIHHMLVFDVLAIHPRRLDCHNAAEVNKSS